MEVWRRRSSLRKDSVQARAAAVWICVVFSCLRHWMRVRVSTVTAAILVENGAVKENQEEDIGHTLR